MIEHRIVLPDGRRLAAAEVGPSNGTPVIYAHGFPGSRLGVELAARDAQASGIRLIGFDRPGWGQSDPFPGRRLRDWPHDVAAAADALECPQFNLLGISGGMPFTLACAAALPDRIRRVAIVCGLGPPAAMHNVEGMMWHNRVGLGLARHTPWLVRPSMALAGPLLKRFFGLAIGNLIRNSESADQEVLSDPEVRQILGRDFREAFRHGGAGGTADGLIYGADWGLDLSSIRPPVYLWHGDADRVVPVAIAHWMIERMPGIHANLRPGEGHFSIVIRCLPEIMRVLRADPAC